MYLSLNNDIPNHGYVVISDIGSTDDTALICYTNRPARALYANSGGDWFGPTGIVVGGLTIGIDNVPGFMRNRDPMIVRLLRNTATDPPSGIPSEGIFHCAVEDATFTVQTVYIGLYNSGGGIYVRLLSGMWTHDTQSNVASISGLPYCMQQSAWTKAVGRPVLMPLPASNCHLRRHWYTSTNSVTVCNWLANCSLPLGYSS